MAKALCMKLAIIGVTALRCLILSLIDFNLFYFVCICILYYENIKYTNQ